jgi:hypothetical protein
MADNEIRTANERLLEKRATMAIVTSARPPKRLSETPASSLEQRQAECPVHGPHVALALPWLGDPARLSPCPECSAEKDRRERVLQIQRAATIAVGDAFHGIYAAEAARRWRLAHLTELALRTGVMPEHASAELSNFPSDRRSL